nr:flagellar biosynthesis repressor FlbT [uncultured Methylobacterium sp.]
MRLSLRAGERVYINGAVLRVDRKVGIELLNDATFLLEGHVLQAEEATTPLRQLYFAVQTMLIAPAEAEAARDLYAGLRAGLMVATREPVLHEGLLAADALITAERPFEALKVIRGLYAAEAVLLAAAGTEPAPAPPALRPGPEALPRRARALPSPAARLETRPRRPASAPPRAPIPAAARGGSRPEPVLEPEA